MNIKSNGYRYLRWLVKARMSQAYNGYVIVDSDIGL